MQGSIHRSLSADVRIRANLSTFFADGLYVRPLIMERKHNVGLRSKSADSIACITKGNNRLYNNMQQPQNKTCINWTTIAMYINTEQHNCATIPKNSSNTMQLLHNEKLEQNALSFAA